MTDFPIDPHAPSLEFHTTTPTPEPPPEALSARQSAPQAPDGPTDGQDAHDGTEGASCCSDPTCTCVQVNAAGRCGCARWDDAPLPIRYRNWRGETSDRAILPIRVWYGATEWHPEPQWLLRAVDVDKDAERDFAIADMQGDRTTPDNAATSSDTADNPLREQITAAIEADAERPRDQRVGIINAVMTVLAVRDREHAALKRAHVALAEQAGRDQATLGRVRTASDQLHRAVLNADGVPLTAYDRGVDTAVRRIRAALDAPEQPQPAAHDNGPSIAEATADDRAHWPERQWGGS